MLVYINTSLKKEDKMKKTYETPTAESLVIMTENILTDSNELIWAPLTSREE